MNPVRYLWHRLRRHQVHTLVSVWPFDVRYYCPRCDQDLRQ